VISYSAWTEWQVGHLSRFSACSRGNNQHGLLDIAIIIIILICYTVVNFEAEPCRMLSIIFPLNRLSGS
jgi:hypothetical protein